MSAGISLVATTEWVIMNEGWDVVYFFTYSDKAGCDLGGGNGFIIGAGIFIINFREGSRL